MLNLNVVFVILAVGVAAVVVGVARLRREAADLQPVREDTGEYEA